MKKTPPLFISFHNLDNYLNALGESLRNQYQADIKKLIDKKLPPIVSISCLSVLFGYSTSFMGAIFRKPENYYRIFKIKKSNNNLREIQAPKVALKVLQKWFAQYLSEGQSSNYSDNAFGFIRGRATVHGAQRHCMAKWVYSLDIKNFFRSITKEMLISYMKNIGYYEESSKLISQLCCYDGKLSEGSPASPILSNLMFKNTDDEIQDYVYNICKENIVYTRYADDLAFSSKQNISENKLKDIKRQVKKIITDNHWKLNDEKERFAVSPQRLKIYGLLVHGEKPRLTKGYRNKIRAFKHILKRQKNYLKNKEKIKGHLAYANSIEYFNKHISIK